MTNQTQEKAKILIVDDKPENLVVLEKLLTPLDVDLYKATSGNDALAYTLEHDFMLILLDVQMPGMDGYEVLDVLSWEERTKYIPVIFITANYADEKHELKGYESGAVDYLFKPINKQILVGKVKVFLELYEQRIQYKQLHLRYQRILEAAGEGIFGIGTDGKINFTNPAAAELLARETHDLIGQNFDAIQPPNANGETITWTNSHIYKNCVEGQVVTNNDSIFIKESGEKLPVEYTATPLHNENNQLAGVVIVFSDITLRKTVEDQLTHLALYDHLTELPNRLLFEKSITQILSRAERHNHMVAVMFLDLDQFKNINDTLGHDVGDMLLRGVAKRLKTCIRESDVVARLGGDEFAIILDEIEKPEAAALIAEKISESLRPPFKLKHHEVFTSTSIGIAVYPISGEDGTTLTKNADIAMYRAKHHGRNHYRFFTTGMNQESMKKLNLAHQFRHALERNELFLCYQPKQNIKTKKIVGMEALLRWQHPQHGTIYPNDIIPICEEIGLMTVIGEWILKTACLQAKKWINNGKEPSTIAINLSSYQLIKGNLEKLVSDVLTLAEMKPSQLELELTESAIMVNPERSQQTLLNLHDLGVKIAIDDFGTGYSSLSYLKRLTIDSLKIDQSFIRDIVTDEDDASIVKTIIGLAHNMNLNVIAEGVENKEQLQFLKENDCDEIQGYFLSKPLTADEMTAFLKDPARVA